jgi:hypothetical protein
MPVNGWKKKPPCWTWCETTGTSPSSRSPRMPVKTRGRFPLDLLEPTHRAARTGSPSFRNPGPSGAKNLPHPGNTATMMRTANCGSASVPKENGSPLSRKHIAKICRNGVNRASGGLGRERIVCDIGFANGSFSSQLFTSRSDGHGFPRDRTGLALCLG